jgi:hypothetical protein
MITGVRPIVWRTLSADRLAGGGAITELPSLGVARSSSRMTAGGGATIAFLLMVGVVTDR